MTTASAIPALEEAILPRVPDETELPLLVLFGDACPPSRAMEPALEELEHKYAGRARIARVDAKRDAELAARYGITCLPTILILEGGHVVRRFLGTAMSWELEEALRELVPQA
jgi:thioredoxin 1